MRAQEAICMQISWHPMQMRDPMQMYALWEAGQDPPLINSGTRCWAENPFLPGVPYLPFLLTSVHYSPAPRIPSRQCLLSEQDLSSPGPFPGSRDPTLLFSQSPHFLWMMTLLLIHMH